MGRVFHIVRTPHSIPDQFPDYRRSNRPASCFPDSIGPLVSPPSTPDSQHHTPRNGTSKNSPVKKHPYVDVYLEFQHRHRPHQPCAECSAEKNWSTHKQRKNLGTVVVPKFFIWQRVKDSNPHIQSQSLLCYLYTNPLDLSAAVISRSEQILLYRILLFCQ